MNIHIDPERRFGGITRLYGADALAALRKARVAIIGLGGVGSWAAEALARSGVGHLRLIDLDHIAESNINRQAHALDTTLGQAKVEAMATRINSIHPQCQVACVEAFLSPDNTAMLTHNMDIVIDAIDDVRAKTALAAHCHAHSQALILCGGAGGKTQSTQVRYADLSQTVNDPLLSKVRAQLRKHHGFASGQTRGSKRAATFGLTAVFVDEAPARAPACAPGAALNCAGYGSAMHVTATVGLAAAGLALDWLIQNRRLT